MNKKSILFGLIFLSSILWLFVSISYAQEYAEEDMNWISVRFCGEWTWATTHDGVFYVEPGKEATVRLCVTNGWTKEVGFIYGFSESWIRDGRYCQGDMTTGNKFSTLIPWTKERKVMIASGSSKIIEEKIVIPPGMSGLQMGCIGYNLAKPENTLVGGMFSLKIRRVGYMDIIVWGESTVKSSIKVLNTTWGIFSTNKKVKAIVDDKNRLKLSFLIKNQGNVSQNISITGTVYNALGFQQNFSITQQQSAPGGQNEFTADVGILPTYKWLFTVSFNIQNDPQFAFAVTDEKLKKSWYISDTSRIFLFSRIRVIVLIVILLVLYRIFVPRRVKVTTA